MFHVDVKYKVFIKKTTSSTIVFLPLQKNEILETEIEYLLQQFDSDMANKQVQTQAT